MFKWDLSEFYTTSGEYLDRAQSPLFNTYHSLSNTICGIVLNILNWLGNKWRI